MPATASVAKTNNADIDGVLSGVKWASPALTYSFPTAMSQYGYSETGFEAMNATQQAAVDQILDMYEAVSGLTFTKVTESSSVHGTLRFAEEDSAGTAYGYYPTSAEQGGDIWLNHTSYNTPLKGTYAYATFVHEIGHALGLDHGQDGLAALPTDHDSLEYSVMTYRSYVGAPLTGYTASQGSYPIGLMLSDISAIQHMYGANYNTNAGNTVYKWSTTTGELSVNNVGQGGSTTNTIFQTIWDGGGIDTYDFSNYATNLTVDLNPGGWTTTSSAQLAKLGFQGQVARGNIANAWLHQGNTASLIENAIGGTGNDRLTGNQANNVLDGGSGNDILAGGKGNDTITGGLGTDTCIIAVNFADCTINVDSLTQLFTISSLLEGIDVLSGIEFIQFNDQTVATSTLTTTVVTDALAPTLKSASPADNAGNVSRSANIVLTFSETVQAGAGNVTVHKADGTIVATLAASSLAIAGAVVTIDPGENLAASTGYYVRVDAGAFTDTNGNGFAGISSTTALNFTTASSVQNGTSSANTMTGSDDADTLNGLGGNDTLNGFGGNDTLNGGSGGDTMNGGDGNDTYVVDSTSDRVNEAANQGVDSVQSSVTFTLGANVENLTLTGSNRTNATGNSLDNVITGNAANNTLTGNDGADTLLGLGGTDTLNGGNGNDTLNGGNGNDSLTGGAGLDFFVFNTALSKSSNIDSMRDFSVIDDTIVLDNAIFKALADGALSSSEFGIGTRAANADVHIFYNGGTGALFYDEDGSGSKAAIQFATLSKNLALTASDFSIV